MNGVASIKETLNLARQYLDGAVQETDTATLLRRLPGATIGSIGEIYGHTIGNEDWAFNQLIQGKEQVLKSGGWAANLGMDPGATEHDWEAAARDHLDELREYGKAVSAATDAFLNSLNDSDLDRPIDFFGRKETMGWVIADTVLVHISFHSGEIASLKGVMGLKGLPW